MMNMSAGPACYEEMLHYIIKSPYSWVASRVPAMCCAWVWSRKYDETQSRSILFYSILFYSNLFYSV